MANEAKIIRTQIIVVDTVDKNSFGDLVFTDKEGSDYKISVNRTSYFEKVILPGVAVQLNYAMSSFKKEYIYSAIQVKDKLPDKPLEAPQAKIKVIEKGSGSNPPTVPSRDAQIEKAVWIKELGEGLRTGFISKDSPEALFYRKEMDRVLEIKAKEVNPEKSRLVEEAKKLEAQEIIKKEDK